MAWCFRRRKNSTTGDTEFHRAKPQSRILENPDYGRDSTDGIFLPAFEPAKINKEAGFRPVGEIHMRLKIAIAVLLLAAVGQAKEKHYQSGKLLKMESVKCGTDEKNGKSLAGEMIGTDSAHMKTKELLCQQYILQTDTVIYTIQPKDDKHPALLPIGEKAQFRIDKDKMQLRVEDADDKEREYLVISMVPRQSDDEATTASKK
jgi:hypothetical protein